jgi:DNA-binding IclR family transcriptional regulator
MAIQSIQRAITILSLFSYETPHIGIMDMAKALGLGKGTVHNIVKTLSEEGLLRQEPDTRKYVLGTKLFSLGSIVAGTLEINRVTMMPATQLAQKTGMVCRVGIWDEDAVLITLSLEPGGPPVSANQIGPRINAYGTAIGRALLAYLPEVDLKTYLKNTRLSKYTVHTISTKKQILKELNATRSRGYALNDQGYILGRCSLAVPIFYSNGKQAAALSISGNAKDFKGKKESRLVDLLLKTTGEINRGMGLF